MPNCHTVIADFTMRGLLAPEEWAVVERNRLRYALAVMPDVRMCPRPECDYAGLVPARSANCTDYECSKCGKQWREPLPAGVFRSVWRMLVSVRWQEGRSFLWKKIHAQHCQKCSAPIEKNGGCKHMTCSRCQYQWCWACGQEWAHHSPTICALPSKAMVLAMALLAALVLLVSWHHPWLASFFLLSLRWLLTVGLSLAYVVAAVLSYPIIVNDFKDPRLQSFSSVRRNLLLLLNYALFCLAGVALWQFPFGRQVVSTSLVLASGGVFVVVSLYAASWLRSALERG